MTSKDKPYEDLCLLLSPSWKATESKHKAVQSSFLDDERPYKVRGPEVAATPAELSLLPNTPSRILMTDLQVLKATQGCGWG